MTDRSRKMLMSTSFSQGKHPPQPSISHHPMPNFSLLSLAEPMGNIEKPTVMPRPQTPTREAHRKPALRRQPHHQLYSADGVENNSNCCRWKRQPIWNLHRAKIDDHPSDDHDHAQYFLNQQNSIVVHLDCRNCVYFYTNVFRQSGNLHRGASGLVVREMLARMLCSFRQSHSCLSDRQWF